VPRRPTKNPGTNEKVVISKKHEMLALTLSILRLCPLYLFYRYDRAKVGLEWDRPANTVVVTYWYNEVLMYRVKAYVHQNADKEKVEIDLRHMYVPDHTPEELALLKGMTIITAFYNLMGVITRVTWQNNREAEDTEDSCTRQY
jgi:hypothetical protein